MVMLMIEKEGRFTLVEITLNANVVVVCTHDAAVFQPRNQVSKTFDIRGVEDTIRLLPLNIMSQVEIEEDLTRTGSRWQEMQPQ